MKKILLLLTAFFIGINGFAQKIHITDSLNRWTVGVTYGLYNTHVLVPYYFGSDTVVNSIAYRKLLNVQPGYVGAGGPLPYTLLREDTVAGKVFFRADSVEKLLYDFKLNVGDTLYSHSSGSSNSDVKEVVQQIDSVLINNIYHKRFQMNNLLGYHDVVVEGIGSLQGLLYPTLHYLDAYGATLICFTQNNQVPVTASVNGIKLCTLGINDNETADKKVLVSPNPFSGSSTIKLSQIIQNGELAIYNMVGQCTQRLVISGTDKIVINAGNWAPGQYFYKITDKQKAGALTGKMMVE